MIHRDTQPRFIDRAIGFGVFATAPIPKGTLVWVLCRLDIVLGPAALAELPPAYRPIIETYAYGDGAGNRILCWDHGRSLNHGCEPGMRGLGDGFEIAVRDIAAGEQLTCEYGGLNLPYRLACRCGSARCRGTIGPEDVLRLWPEWDAEVAAAVSVAASVPQPLLAFARDPRPFRDWVEGRAPLPSQRADYAG